MCVYVYIHTNLNQLDLLQEKTPVVIAKYIYIYIHVYMYKPDMSKIYMRNLLFKTVRLEIPKKKKRQT